MYLIILFFPLIGSIISGFFGYYLSGKYTIKLSSLFIFFSLIIMIKAIVNVISIQKTILLKAGNWLDSLNCNFSWEFLFDSLSLSLGIIVVSISILVHLYSIEYIKLDPHLSRFYSYISLFTFFILLLVFGSNLIVLFIGWEGVGLCSYLLINFWFTRLQANKAAIKAIVINRVGDFFLLLSILIIYDKIQSFEYSIIFSMISFIKEEKFLFLNINNIDIIAILIFIGSIGKSAQFGLHIWLPDAIEGPTPVSALIHAATIVTAGIFLIVRFSALFEYSIIVRYIIIYVGVLTAVFGAIVGTFQNDIKKIIAYSTCSQLGYIMFICGFSEYSIAIFHLIMHAYFKALLFLASGWVIHSIADEQDIRRIGGARKTLPISYAAFVLGSFSLIGFPGFSGFFSKDIILESVFLNSTLIGHIVFWLGILAAMFTSFYSIKLIFFVFLNKFNPFIEVFIVYLWNGDTELNRIYLAVSYILIICSIFFGYFFKDIFIGIGTGFWGQYLYYGKDYIFKDTYLEYFVWQFFKIIPFFCSIFMLFFCFLFYSIFYKKKNIFHLLINEKYIYIYNFFNKKWFIDNIVNKIFVLFLLEKTFFYNYIILDKGILSTYFGSFFFIQFSYNVSKKINDFQNNPFYFSFFFILVTFLFFILILFGNLEIIFYLIFVLYLFF